MEWLIMGSSGLLGSGMVRALEKIGRVPLSVGRAEFNSLSSSEWTHKLALRSPVVVNAVGFTDVDLAESRPDEAFEVNSQFPRSMGEVVGGIGGRLVHISTDYVFDGTSSTPYKTTDTPNPQSAYGRSKLAGEIAVQESGADYQIFRTAWLYGANGNCFPKTVAKVLKEQGQMKVVADQIGQPTWTKDLAELIIAHQDLEATSRPNIVHATASGSCSWYEFACEIALSLGYDPEKVIIPITTAEYPTPAKRPAYSVLDNQNETGLVIGDWRERWKEAAPLVLAEYLK
jgi:dTDP-4-dehydrorhamnose reductase